MRLLKNTALIASSSIVGNLILIVTTPIITRLYSPEEFGDFSLFISLVTIISVIASLKFETLIPFQKSNYQARNILYASVFVLIIGVLFLGIFLVAFEKGIKSTFENYDSIIPILGLLTILSLGLVNIFTQKLARDGDFVKIAQVRIIQPVAATASQVLLAYSPLSSIGLIFGQVISRIISLVPLSKTIQSHKIQRIFRARYIKRTPRLIKPYLNHSFHLSVAGFANSLSANVPIILFGLLYNNYTVGLYGLALRLMISPISLCSSALTQAMLGEFSKTDSLEKLQGMISRTTKWLAVMITPSMILLISNIDWVVPLLFGDDWSEASYLILILSPWMIAIFVGAALQNVAIYFSKQKSISIYNTVLLVSKLVIVMVVHYLFNNFKYTLISLSGVSFILTSGFTLYLMSLLRFNVKLWSSFILLKIITFMAFVWVHSSISTNFELDVLYDLLLAVVLALLSIIILFQSFNKIFKSDNYANN